MIAPNMATMLAFLATDADIEQGLLQEALRIANLGSFNAITVDGDTSTNDMAVIMAGGTGPSVEAGSEDLRLFTAGLESLMGFLARLIVIDGEGATKLVEINVQEARSAEEAVMAARTIAQSSLVKTALHGEDANWGRIIAAAGRSGAMFREEDLELYFEELPILRRGLQADFSEEDAAAILARPSYAITLRLGAGTASARVWTCDLSKEYVDINGSYRS
jgi:glutamate N-acetyltransferase/amino-acid N-acetyltransferase